jgi:hypothetical protein
VTMRWPRAREGSRTRVKIKVDYLARLLRDGARPSTLVITSRYPRRYTKRMPFDSQIGYIVGAVTALLFLWVFLRHLRAKLRRLPYFPRPHLLTKGELAFYQKMRLALPPAVLVSFKVRLSDVINCPGRAWKEGYGAKISQKHLDFVVVDAETTAVRFVVELDDKTHRRRDRQHRDAFVDAALAAAGVPIVRVIAAASYDPARLRDLLAGG